MYILDANVFIEAKQTWYAFDICPGFWDWLVGAADDELIASTPAVYEELLPFEDELSEFARANDHIFFEHSRELFDATKVVNQWVESHAGFSRAHKASFLAGADPEVVACGMLTGACVVTHEKLVGEDSTKVKVPNVCKAHDVEYMRAYDMLRKHDARFSL